MEIRVEQQVAEGGIAVEGFLDLAQEGRADDAAGAPHQGDAAVVEIPVVLLGGLAQQHETLRVGDDLGGQQRLADVLDEGLPVAVELELRPAEDLRSRHALVLHGAQAAGINRFADQRDRHAQVERADAGPLAGAFLAGGVEDLVHHVLALLVLVSQDVAGDFDEVAVELALVPLGEDVVHLLVAHAEPFLQKLVGLADELHVAVLDAVVDHLDVVAGAVFAHPVAAGLAVGRAGADGLEDVLHQRPRLGAAAGHHRGAETRAFFAARNARADIQQAFAFQVFGAADGVGEMRVAAIDDQVARLQVGQQQLDEIVHRLARLHHQHDLARPLQQGRPSLRWSARR